MFFLMLLMLGSAQTDSPATVTTGAVWRELPDTVAYEATIPLTYETPWATKKFNALHTTTHRGCEGNKSELCVIHHQVQEIEAAITSEITRLEYSLDTRLMGDRETSAKIGYRHKRALDFLGDALSWCCGVATQRKLDDLNMDSEDLRDALKRINAGLQEDLKGIAENSNKFQNYSETVADSVGQIQLQINNLQHAMSSVENGIRHNDNLLEKNMIMVMDHSFQALYNNLRLTSSLSNLETVHSCRLHHLPVTVINPDILTQDLLNLQKRIRIYQQDLAIPVEDLSRYYQLALADCVFSEDKLLVQLRVPIRHADKKWTIIEMTSVPFAWQNHTCSIMQGNIYMAVAVNKSKSISTTRPILNLRPLVGISVHQCKPYHDQLCYIPRFTGDGSHGSQCAIKTYTGATIKDLSAYCPFQCQETKEMIITEIKEDEYHVTHPEAGMSVACDGSPTRNFDKNSEALGTIKMLLPCHCSLTSEGREIIPRRFPCPQTGSQEYNIIHVIPAAWSNLHTLVLDSSTRSSLIFSNISECLNRNWTSTVPHLNLTKTTFSNNPYEDIISDLNKRVRAVSTKGDTAEWLLYAWNIFLTIGIVCLFMKHYPY